MKPRILIRHKWALGDTLLLSALVRDIHRAYPGQYLVGVDTHYSHFWKNCPHVTAFDPADTRVQQVVVGWGKAIRNPWARVGGRLHMRHILAWYHYDFEQKLGMPVPVTEPKGEVFLTPREARPIIEGRYWLVMGGGKQDMTIKLWPTAKYQAVVDGLRERGIHCVQGGAAQSKHIHPPLRNCLSMVGKTNDIFDFFNLVLHAEGVISPVSAGMHLAAVYDKPCVVIAGAREEPWFEWYGNAFEAFGPGCPPVKVPHKFLHTLDQLPCCSGHKACWRRKTVPLRPADQRQKPKDYCLDPVLGEYPVAKCMDLIQPSHVINAVMDYYDQNALPPIGTQAAPNCTQLPETAPTRPAQITIQTPPRMVRVPDSRPVVQPLVQQLPPQGVPAAVCRPTASALDHPLLGGRLTICVLCYGDHTDLHRRCLESILGSLPRHRMDLRVGCNAVPAATLAYLELIRPDRIYNHPQNVYKDAVMREMFYDPQYPLGTEYLVWFDDDTQVVDPRWAEVLAEAVIANHPQGCRLYGDRRYHDLNVYAKPGHRPDQWFREGTWWRNRPLRVRNSDRCGPNGSCIDFCVGYFWAIHVAALREAQIPDARLVQAGDDIVFGAQLYQAGYKIKLLNQQKKLVWCPTREQGGRREFSKPVSVFPWAGG